MNDLLQFIINNCSKLYEEYGFKFVDSEVSKSFGGNAILVLASENLKLKFIRDRGQLFLDFHSNYDKNKNNWYSLDVVRQMVTNEKEYFSQLDESNGIFLRENIEKVLSLFSNANIDETSKKLKILERKRAKELFG